MSQDENAPDRDAEEQAAPDADDHAGSHCPPVEDAHDTVDGSRLVAGTEGVEGGPDDARDEGLGQK